MSSGAAYDSENGYYSMKTEALYAEEPAMMEEAAYEMDYQATADVNSDAGGGVLEEAASNGRKFIKNAYIEAETMEYDSLIANIKSKVSALGGYIEESSTSGNNAKGQTRYGSILARIPSAKLDEFTEHIEGSCNITDMNESVQDITLQYVDADSRKKSLEIERDRLLSLMERAESVSDIIEIESRLGQVRYELESAASQLRVMDNQVDYATVRIGINEVKIYTPPEERTMWQEIADGFCDNVRGLTELARSLFIDLVAGVPIILVLVVFVIILAKIVKLIKKRFPHIRLRPRRKGKAGQNTADTKDKEKDTNDKDKE